MKPNIRDRLATSVETALDLGQGILKIQEGKNGSLIYLTEVFVCPETGVSFAPLTSANFNFNSIHGACSACKGAGGRQTICESLIFEDLSKSLIAQIGGILDRIPKQMAMTFHSWLKLFFAHYKIDEEKPPTSLSPSVLKKLLTGSSDLFELKTSSDGEIQHIQSTWQGVLPFLNRLLGDKKESGTTARTPLCPMGRMLIL